MWQLKARVALLETDNECAPVHCAVIDNIDCVEISSQQGNNEVNTDEGAGARARARRSTGVVNATKSLVEAMEDTGDTATGHPGLPLGHSSDYRERCAYDVPSVDDIDHFVYLLDRIIFICASTTRETCISDDLMGKLYALQQSFCNMLSREEPPPRLAVQRLERGRHRYIILPNFIESLLELQFRVPVIFAMLIVSPSTVFRRMRELHNS
uniref:Uncharacterized protein n=1 Tax=Branchiostoma floridae TaxID=7739 RepID=C3ZXM4_BRAFL|eukprot:XP_002586676.1 hypothetical protein BRAFLDRAFT_105483 [Branchiostoma floridae]